MKLSLKYTGLPIHLTLNDFVIPWRNVFLLNKNTGGWKFSNDFHSLYFYELGSWDRDYKPPFSLNGKTVLDIGAGCGETAKFFLDSGAEHVICVENNPTCIKYLKTNATKFPITVVPEAFRNEMLEIPHDYMKMDIEGYEALLFEGEQINNYKNPCVIEVHNLHLIEKFRKNGFHGDPPNAKNHNISITTLHRW